MKPIRTILSAVLFAICAAASSAQEVPDANFLPFGDATNTVRIAQYPVTNAYAQTKAACGALDKWGNCWEWTSTEITASNGAERGQKVNAIKGGSWYANRRSCLTDFQSEGRRPSGCYNTVGFRVVLTPKTAAAPVAPPSPP